MANTRQGRSFSSTVSVVCGGSKGIGRATAHAIVRRGGSVCLVARDAQTLREVERELKRDLAPDAFVESIACDTTRRDLLEPEFEAFIERRGVPEYLLNLVGGANPDYVGSFEVEAFRHAMEANYFGQLVPTLVMLPHFERAGRGHVANTSSALGFMGVMGYATYAPSKYAIVGLTEVLRNELAHKGVTFSVLFPPDTDTPGFALENETKPAEWFATDAAKLMTPEAVADAFVNGLNKGRFYITPGQSAWLWRLARWAPGVLHWYADRELAAARRKLETS